MSSIDTTTPKILTAMAELGAADAKTISEVAGVGYSTAVRKLRGWSLTDEVIRIDRGNDPAHWELRNGEAPASTIAPDSITADVDDAPDVPAPAEDNGSEAPDTTDASISEPPTIEPLGTEPPATESLATEASSQEEADATDIGVQKTSGTDTAGRRKPGTLLQDALKVLRANPDREYKVLEVCRLIERNNAADGLVKKVSSGAVANALNKACGDGSAMRCCDKPVTYKAV